MRLVKIPSAAEIVAFPATVVGMHTTIMILVTEVFLVGSALASSDWQGLVASVIRVQRDRLERSAKTGLWNVSSEAAYYVACFEPTAPFAAHATVAIFPPGPTTDTVAGVIRLGPARAAEWIFGNDRRPYMTVRTQLKRGPPRPVAFSKSNSYEQVALHSVFAGPASNLADSGPSRR